MRVMQAAARLWGLCVILLLPVFLFLPASLCCAASVKLGINYPLTGPYSVEGLDQIRAARLAVDEINRAGGILGKQLLLVPRDSASDVLVTRLNVNRLIDAGCSMIFGGSSSAVAVTASDVCQKRKIPFFGTLTYSSETTVEDGHRYAFRECNDSWMAAMLMAEWLKEHFPGKRYHYITADYIWGWSTEDSLRRVTATQDKEKHPGELVPLGNTDFTQALQKVGADSPDVLVMVLFGKDLAYALQQADKMGLKERMQIVVPNLTLGMAERSSARAMEGVVGTLPWTWRVPYLFNHKRGQEFVEAFTARYRRYPSTSGASAYTIVYQYKSAVERAGSFAPAAVVKALEGHSFALLKGRQTWRALDHQNVQTVYMVQGNGQKTVLADPMRQDYFSIILHKEGEQLVLPPDQWRARRKKAGLPPYLEPLDDGGQ